MILPDKVFPVEFGGYWELTSGDKYDSISYLDEDDYPEASSFANECAKRYNNYENLVSNNEQLKEKLNHLLKWMEARYLRPKEYKRAQLLLDSLTK